MRNGDISNRAAHVVGVRLNGFLVDPARLGLMGRAWAALGGGFGGDAVNPTAARFVSRLFYGSPFAVEFVYVGKGAPDRYALAADALPRNGLRAAKDLFRVGALLRCGELSYFVAPPEDVEQMDGEHAYTLEGFKSKFKSLF